MPEQADNNKQMHLTTLPMLCMLTWGSNTCNEVIHNSIPDCSSVKHASVVAVGSVESCVLIAPYDLRPDLGSAKNMDIIHRIIREYAVCKLT